MLKKEFLEYQTEIIPKDFITMKEIPKSGRLQASYWKMAHENAGISMVESRPPTDITIDEYWMKIEEIKDECGLKKYPNLCSLVKAHLTISHSNADPERGSP